MRRRHGIFAFAALALAASLTACGDDTTSASDNADANAGAAKSDTVFVRDTIYIPVKDSSGTSVTDTNTSNGSAENPVSSSSRDDGNEPGKEGREPSAASSDPSKAPGKEGVESSSSTSVKPASSSATQSSSAEQAVPTSSATTQTSSADQSSELDPKPIWNDEFEGTALDESKWGYNIGTGDNGWGNSELEYYTDRKENVYVKDGLLHIRANLETNADDIANKFGGQKYTSARLLSQNKFAFTYGTVEARIALPAGKGIWPAFWMLGENIDKVSWPTCGEIDIIEAVNDDHIVYGTHHWASNGSHAQYGNNTADYYGKSTTIDITQFHNYKMTWDKEFIRIFVDDFMYQEIDIKDASNDMGTFHKPFFFILNVAVGGSWPGFDIDDTQFPTEMLVDYIRVYK